jgi:hypothetical protein
MSNTKSDRYTIGFLAGTIAGFVADLISFILTQFLKLGKIGYEDFASVLVFGGKTVYSGGKHFCPLGTVILPSLATIMVWINSAIYGLMMSFI